MEFRTATARRLHNNKHIVKHIVPNIQLTDVRTLSWPVAISCNPVIHCFSPRGPQVAQWLGDPTELKCALREEEMERQIRSLDLEQPACVTLKVYAFPTQDNDNPVPVRDLWKPDASSRRSGWTPDRGVFTPLTRIVLENIFPFGLGSADFRPAAVEFPGPVSADQYGGWLLSKLFQKMDHDHVEEQESSSDVATSDRDKYVKLREDIENTKRLEVHVENVVNSETAELIKVVERLDKEIDDARKNVCPEERMSQLRAALRTKTPKAMPLMTLTQNLLWQLELMSLRGSDPRGESSIDFDDTVVKYDRIFTKMWISVKNFPKFWGASA